MDSIQLETSVVGLFCRCGTGSRNRPCLFSDGQNLNLNILFETWAKRFFQVKFIFLAPITLEFYGFWLPNLESMVLINFQ